MRSILVTGASGAIGQSICHNLAGDGWFVVAQGRKSPPDHVGHRQIGTGPFSRDMDWKHVLQGVDCVVHTAALTWSSTPSYEERLAEFRKVNVAATHALVEAAASAGVKRIVYLSSMSMHGTSSQDAMSEDDSLSPSTSYSQSKLEAERVLFERGTQIGVDIVALRLPQVLGEQYTGNMALLAKLIQKRIPLPFGSIRRNRRCRLSLNNLHQAIQLALKEADAAGKVFLLADGKPQSTRAMIEEIGERLGCKPILLPVPEVMLSVIIGIMPRRFLGRLSRSAMRDELLGNFEINIACARNILGYNPVGAEPIVKSAIDSGELRL